MDPRLARALTANRLCIVRKLVQPNSTAIAGDAPEIVERCLNLSFSETERMLGQPEGSAHGSTNREYGWFGLFKKLFRGTR
jgi:hypothetical protein